MVISGHKPPIWNLYSYPPCLEVRKAHSPFFTSLMSLSSFAYYSELIIPNTFSEHCRSPDEKQPLLPLGLYFLPKVLFIVICLSSFLILLPQTTTKQHLEKKKKTFMRNQLIKRLLNSGVNRKLSKSKLSEQFGAPSCQGHCPKNSNAH